MVAIRIMSWASVAITLLAAMSGCGPTRTTKEIKDITTTIKFRQVCATRDVDERDEIVSVLRSVRCYRCDQPDWQLIKTDDDMSVYEGTAVLHKVESFRELDKLYTDMNALRDKPRNGHVIDFVLQDRSASLEFCSNYVKSSLWTTIRGQTLPCAVVELWLPDGTRVSPTLDEKGHWQFQLKIDKGRDWVYGVSRALEGCEQRERTIEKYFRVRVYDSRFEELTKERFQELRKKEP